VRRALAILLLAGCSSAPVGSDFERSCAGAEVLLCDPYEYSIVSEARLEPAGIGPLDPGVMATVHATLRQCEMRPGGADVQVQALVGGDGGPVRVVDLGLMASDDGTHGDSVAGDGTIEWRIGSNPFGSAIPENATIQLRFTPLIGGCTGDALDVGYRTGDRFVPP
jgi:hypothetical protein